MRGYKKLDQKRFNELKTVVNMAAASKTPVSRLAKVVGTSQATLSLVKNAEDYAAYKAKRAEQRLSRTSQMDVKIPDTVVATTSSTTDTEQQFDFRLLNDNLVLMANKMEAYAEACKKLEIAIYALRKSWVEPAETKKGKWF